MKGRRAIFDNFIYWCLECLLCYRPMSTPPAYAYECWRKLALQALSGKVPSGLRLSSSLSFAKLRIRSIPEDFSVDGDLDLRQCQRLRRIGNGLWVAGDLLIGGSCPEGQPWEEHLAEDTATGSLMDSLRKLSRSSQCPLASLPENLTVGGNLHLKGCHRISALPEQRHLGGDVSIESCSQFRRLPTDLEIAGSLTLKGCRNLTELPPQLRVSGDLRLIGVPIKQLPVDLEVCGRLILECYRRIPTLPKGLVIRKDLILRRCSDVVLPEDLRVQQHLIVDKCRGRIELPKNICVGGNIVFLRCDGPLVLPAGLQIRNSLKIKYCCNLRELPEQLDVPYTLDLHGCSAITHLPSRLRIGFARGLPPREPVLIVSDCTALRELPEDLVVHGPIDLAGSGVQDLPKTLADRCRLAWRGMLVPPDVVFHPETLRPNEFSGNATLSCDAS